MYNDIEPTLAALDAVKDFPGDNESASSVGAYLRQTRRWMYNFLSRVFEADTGQLKKSAFGEHSFPRGVIRGSDPVTNQQREIAQRSITGLDIAQDTISSLNIGRGQITSEHIAPGTIRGSHIAAATIGPEKLQRSSIDASLLVPGSIGNSQIATGAITEDKLADGSIGSAQVANRAITGDKLPAAPAGYVLVGGNTVNGVENCFAPMRLSGALSIDASGNVTALAGIAVAYARVFEEAASGVGAGSGSGTVGTFLNRGQTCRWRRRFDRVGIIELDEDKIVFRQEGVYLIMARSPVSGGGAHKARIYAFPKGDDQSFYRFYYGTSELAPTGITTVSEVCALIEVTLPSTDSFAYFVLQHAYTTSATNAFGAPSNFAGIPEIYADINIFKLV